MKNVTITLLAATLVILLIPGLAFCLTDRDITDLKTNGIGDDTLALIIQEKAVANGSVTVQELISLKRAGIGEKTLQTLVRESSGRQRPKTIVYGRDLQQRRSPSVDEIIALKNAGVSDEVVNTKIEHSPTEIGSRSNDTQRAWQMLESMRIRVNP